LYLSREDLINALHETKRGKAHYHRNPMNELYSLERALIAIKELSLDEDSSEYKAACQAVGQCQKCIESFL